MPEAKTEEIDKHFDRVGTEEIKQRKWLNEGIGFQKPSGGVMLSEPDSDKYELVITGSGTERRKLNG